MIGAALILVGIIFLLKNLGLIAGINWDIVWPVAVIILGAVMLFKKYR